MSNWKAIGLYQNGQVIYVAYLAEKVALILYYLMRCDNIL